MHRHRHRLPEVHRHRHRLPEVHRHRHRLPEVRRRCQWQSTTARPGTDVIIFIIFSPKNRRKKWRFWLKLKLNFKKWIITLVFEKNANFFRRKLSKIAENCDLNIDPRDQLCIVEKKMAILTRKSTNAYKY
jgi:hypothetical protein